MASSYSSDLHAYLDNRRHDARDEADVFISGRNEFEQVRMIVHHLQKVCNITFDLSQSFTSFSLPFHLGVLDDVPQRCNIRYLWNELAGVHCWKFMMMLPKSLPNLHNAPATVI